MKIRPKSFEGECDNFGDDTTVKDFISRHTSKPERAIFLLETIVQKPLVKLSGTAFVSSSKTITRLHKTSFFFISND